LLQVDNMLYTTPLPVVVFKDPNAAPFVRMRAVKRNPTIRELEKSKELASSIGTLLSCSPHTPFSARA
jgi:hypothetical protein